MRAGKASATRHQGQQTHTADIPHALLLGPLPAGCGASLAVAMNSTKRWLLRRLRLKGRSLHCLAW